jgi:hypothetical protein
MEAVFMSKTCSVEGCNGKHYAKGFCQKHYTQYRKYGEIIDNKPKSDVIDCIDHAELILYDKQGKEVARTIIDLEYVDIVKDYKWHLSVYGYATSKKVGKLHRFIMNCPDDMVIDHINRDPLDNRRENLRICTQQQNNMNKSIQSNNTSGIPGVYWNKNRNKWVARITVNKKTKSLGYYTTLKEAAEARRQAEIEYFGEYRRVD